MLSRIYFFYVALQYIMTTSTYHRISLPKILTRLAKDMCFVVRNENFGEKVATVHYTITTRWTRSLQVFTSANQSMFTM